MELVEAGAIAALAVIATVLIHYEMLRAASRLIPYLTAPSRNRVIPSDRILIVIAAAFIAHLLEIMLYAVIYFVMEQELGLGRVAGELSEGAFDYVYFSLTTFTTLGVGDVYPVGPLRLVAAVESLNGLLLIGWSASFTYLSMEKFWELHRHKS